MKSPGKQTFPNTLWLDKKAQQLRFEFANSSITMEDSKDPSDLLGSHFELYLGKLPLPSGYKALQFNEHVTELVISEYVLKLDDPYLVTFLGAKVIEQNFYQLFDPQQRAKPIMNLSVSKHFGTFFTPPEIAEIMFLGLARSGKNNALLDPCLGSGVLLASSLLFSDGCSYDSLIGIELDSRIAIWAERILFRVAELTGYKGDVLVHQGDGLDFLLSNSSRSAGSFDIIINPPYGRLRVTKDRATNLETLFYTSGGIAELHAKVTDNAKAIRSKYPIFKEERGILEYSRLYFRACAEFASRGSSIAIITPDSWMSGKDGIALRKFLVENHLIDQILLVKEGSGKFSTVNQSTSITFIDSRARNKLSIGTFFDKTEELRTIEYSKLMCLSPKEMALPKASGTMLETFERLSLFERFREITWIINARGEVDQSALQDLFCFERTSIPLVRGEHIGRFSYKHFSTLTKPSFLVEPNFLEYIVDKPKRNHFEKPRLVGRQCSYRQQRRRLMYSHIPAGHAVGNSCNYISVNFQEEKEEKERRYLLLGLLNSAVLDWYFRIENSNNHVGNYEIDNLPFPRQTKWFPLIASVAYQLEHYQAMDTPPDIRWLECLLEALVALSYDIEIYSKLQLILDSSGCDDIAQTINYAVHLKRGSKMPNLRLGELFFNHEIPALSELDRQIISHVPEGGNWQDIPVTVPSERLKQIRDMSAVRGVVRTTYYGRLRKDQPAYTINTYFNRPGNGTHIHPELPRTLTSREAARLQSFPDKYIFSGSEGAVRNQIGNAVPPLLGAAIGEKFLPYSHSKLCIDVFCGAGGLSYGLESSGWEVIGAVDNDKDALNTYCLNRPSILEPEKPTDGYTSVFQRDLHDKEAFEDVIARFSKTLNGRKLDMLVGGPPCQGFSHAGFRLSNDKRNDLASIYLHFAERLRPTIFILENVEGLATFNKGKIVEEIGKTLRELGYRVKQPIWKLSAEQYGAPQMRKRVFIVATTDDTVDLSPPTPTFDKCAGRRENKNSTGLFDGLLLRPNTVADALAGLSLPAKSLSMLSRWLTGAN